MGNSENKPVKYNLYTPDGNLCGTAILCTEKILNNMSLKRDLEKAVIEERYEDAALIRDKIKDLANSIYTED